MAAIDASKHSRIRLFLCTKSSHHFLYQGTNTTLSSNTGSSIAMYSSAATEFTGAHSVLKMSICIFDCKLLLPCGSKLI
jgi:hypothetical protein